MSGWTEGILRYSRKLLTANAFNASLRSADTDISWQILQRYYLGGWLVVFPLGCIDGVWRERTNLLKVIESNKHAFYIAEDVIYLYCWWFHGLFAYGVCLVRQNLIIPQTEKYIERHCLLWFLLFVSAENETEIFKSKNHCRVDRCTLFGESPCRLFRFATVSK